MKGKGSDWVHDFPLKPKDANARPEKYRDFEAIVDIIVCSRHNFLLIAIAHHNHFVPYNSCFRINLFTGCLTHGMSGFITEPLRSDERGHGRLEDTEGQRHDRISGGILGVTAVTRSGRDEPETEVDISAGQKMLSAVSGSLLTSLLGKPCSSINDLLSCYIQS